jgi:peptide/nickel transport system substrate-binding protein
VNDTKVIEAIAQMWTRLGVDTSVETLPPANFFSRASQGADGWPEFGVYLTGWGSSTGEGSDPLRNISATFDASAGFGQANRSRYSNPRVDELLKRAIATMDDAERAKLLAETNDVAFADQTMIPVHWQVNIWAAKKGFTVEPRVDEWTLVTGIRRQ